VQTSRRCSRGSLQAALLEAEAARKQAQEKKAAAVATLKELSVDDEAPFTFWRFGDDDRDSTSPEPDSGDSGDSSDDEMGELMLQSEGALPVERLDNLMARVEAHAASIMDYMDRRDEERAVKKEDDLSPLTKQIMARARVKACVSNLPGESSGDESSGDESSDDESSD